MTKADIDIVFEAINKTTIPEEMSTVYVLANAVDMMLSNTYNRIRNVYITKGYTFKDNEALRGPREYCDMVRRAMLLFQQKVEPQISDATFGEKHNAENYKGFQNDSREFCQLVLAFTDRTARSEEAADEIFRLLEKLPSGGIFSDKDILKYRRQ